MKSIYKNILFLIYSILIISCFWFWLGQFKVEITSAETKSYIILPYIAYPSIIIFCFFNLYVTKKLFKNDKIEKTNNDIKEVESEIKLLKLQKELQELKK